MDDDVCPTPWYPCPLFGVLVTECVQTLQRCFVEVVDSENEPQRWDEVPAEDRQFVFITLGLNFITLLMP